MPSMSAADRELISALIVVSLVSRIQTEKPGFESSLELMEQLVEDSIDVLKKWTNEI